MKMQVIEIWGRRKKKDMVVKEGERKGNGAIAFPPAKNMRYFVWLGLLV